MTLFVLTCFSQETITLKKEDKKSKSREVYSVLASDQSVMHGAYTKYEFGEIILTGFYDNGHKDSIWIEYDGYRNSIISKTIFKNDGIDGYYVKYDSNGKEVVRGNYSNYKRIGTWEILTEKGYQKYEYLYIDQKSTSNNAEKDNSDSLSYELIEGNDTTTITLDKNPELKGGKNQFMDFLQRNLIYPQDAIENGIQGKVWIQYLIQEDGNLSDFKIINGLNNSLDDEALRVMMLASKKWIPAQYQGKPFATRMTSPISFKML